MDENKKDIEFKVGTHITDDDVNISSAMIEELSNGKGDDEDEQQ